jgi:curved DNA-binding protein CbpA
LKDYYAILQIPKASSLDEIKRAYRRLAREYHPDVSTLPNAKELFITINEAYEYLLNKITYEESLKKSKENFTEETAQSVIDAWLIAEKERMRARARKYADMRYNHFKQTEFYRSTDVYSKILGFLYLILGLAVLFVTVSGTINEIKHNPLQFNVSYIASAIMVFLMGCILTGFASNRLIVAFKKKM